MSPSICASRNRFPCCDAAWVPDAACRTQSVYRELSLRETDLARILGDISFPDYPDDLSRDNYVFAGIVACIPVELIVCQCWFDEALCDERNNLGAKNP